jgi:Uma2 family endonuclease
MNSLLTEPVKQRRFSVREYHQMADLGIFQPTERLELINGQIITMSPQNPPHAATTSRVGDCLRELVAGTAKIRSQLPVLLHNFSEPEPDVAVVRIERRDYADRHPTPADIFLIVEVSDATLDFDIGEKKLDYARSEIADYWVVDINGEQLFVFRNPVSGQYQEEITLGLDAVISPLAFPDTQVLVARFFPPND